MEKNEPDPAVFRVKEPPWWNVKPTAPILAIKVSRRVKAPRFPAAIKQNCTR